MKNIELTDNEIYFLARHMQSLWIWEENKYAKSIYDKAELLLIEIVAKRNTVSDFKREYELELEWVRR